MQRADLLDILDRSNYKPLTKQVEWHEAFISLNSASDGVVAEPALRALFWVEVFPLLMRVLDKLIGTVSLFERRSDPVEHHVEIGILFSNVTWALHFRGDIIKVLDLFRCVNHLHSIGQVCCIEIFCRMAPLQILSVLLDLFVRALQHLHQKCRFWRGVPGFVGELDLLTAALQVQLLQLNQFIKRSNEVATSQVRPHNHIVPEDRVIAH